MKPFPVIVTAVFIALAIVSVLIFATFTSFKKNAIGTVVIWGSLPHSVFDALVSKLAEGNNDAYADVSYRSIPEKELVPSLVEAIAAGTGPDLVIFPGSALVGQGNKLSSIPYSSLSRRDFQNTFIQAGEVFLSPDGVKAIPFTVDPLVMYWNRTLFSNAGIAQPPRYWDELGDMSPTLTKATQNGTLTQGAVALGAWDNVVHSKSVFLTLLNQLGDTVVGQDEKGLYTSLFFQAQQGGVVPADSAVRFYTDFSDPAKPVYSWNRSQPDSRSAFIAGKLAIYFGTVSELQGMREANPNLNFDVAPVPSIRGGGAGVAADITGLAIPRGSKNPSGALLVAKDFTSPSSLEILASELMLPSVRRDAPPPASGDSYAGLFHNAALLSFSFLDPDPSSTDSIFKRMIEGVSSGKFKVTEATRAADDELRALLGTTQ